MTSASVEPQLNLTLSKPALMSVNSGSRAHVLAEAVDELPKLTAAEAEAWVEVLCEAEDDVGTSEAIPEANTAEGVSSGVLLV